MSDNLHCLLFAYYCIWFLLDSKLEFRVKKKYFQKKIRIIEIKTIPSSFIWSNASFIFLFSCYAKKWRQPFQTWHYNLFSALPLRFFLFKNWFSKLKKSLFKIVSRIFQTFFSKIKKITIFSFKAVHCYDYWETHFLELIFGNDCNRSAQSVFRKSWATYWL